MTELNAVRYWVNDLDIGPVMMVRAEDHARLEAEVAQLKGLNELGALQYRELMIRKNQLEKRESDYVVELYKHTERLKADVARLQLEAEVAAAAALRPQYVTLHTEVRELDGCRVKISGNTTEEDSCFPGIRIESMIGDPQPLRRTMDPELRELVKTFERNQARLEAEEEAARVARETGSYIPIDYRIPYVPLGHAAPAEGIQQTPSYCPSVAGINLEGLTPEQVARLADAVWDWDESQELAPEQVQHCHDRFRDVHWYVLWAIVVPIIAGCLLWWFSA